MTAEKLRKSILQLAIQGKLVPQDPSDEPASVLLERVRAEKKRLIKEGKVKPDKHESYIYKRGGSYFEKVDGIERCIDDEIPFEIPESWEWVRMSCVANIVVGATPSTAEFEYWYHGTIPWLPSGCCQDGPVNSTFPQIKMISQKGYDSCSTILMDPGTVLIALTGATAGKVGLLEFKACANQSVVGISPYSGIVNQFIFYQLMARRQEILSDCVGSAQPHISKDYIFKMYVAIPPIREQSRIVATLSLYEPLLKEYEELEKQKNAL